jgi:hypothetical protein
MGMTRRQILDAGLELAGRKDLLSQGRTWLNLFLERQYMTYDWPWLIKTSADLAVVEGQSLPDDYLRMKSLVLIDNGQETPLETITADQFDDVRRQQDQVGNPIMVYLDQSDKTIHYWPLPIRAFTYRLRYFYLPTPLDLSVTDDNSEPTWGEMDDILVHAIYVRALQHLDDARYGSESQALTAMLSEAKMNSVDRRAGKSKIPFGKSFSNRFQNKRRNYF